MLLLDGRGRVAFANLAALRLAPCEPGLPLAQWRALLGDAALAWLQQAVLQPRAAREPAPLARADDGSVRLLALEPARVVAARTPAVPPESAGHHRHQRQDHRHLAHRACCCSAAGLNVAVAGNIGPALAGCAGRSAGRQKFRLKREAAAQVEARSRRRGSAGRGPMPVAQAARLLPARGQRSVETDADAQGPTDCCHTRRKTTPVPAPDEGDDEGPSRDAGAAAHREPPAATAPAGAPGCSNSPASSSTGIAGGAWDTVPTAATVLNITEDHLDWHGSMAAYGTGQGCGFRRTGADAAEPRRPPASWP